MGNWESYVRKVVPYVPGEQPQEQRMIKLIQMKIRIHRHQE